MNEKLTPPVTSLRIRAFPFGLALGLLVVAGASLRFDGLTARDVWLDESCTFYAVHHLFDWPENGPDQGRELAHRPYFLLLHLWTRLSGETAWGLRSFSALVGCLSVAVIGLVGTYLGNRRAGLMAAGLAAFHPLHVYYSQEARVYALWALEAAICLYALYAAARTLRARWWIAYGLVVWVLVLTHYYTLLWLPGTVAVILAAADRRRAMRQWLVTHAVLAASLVPLLWFVILPHAECGPKLWLRQLWQDYPGIAAVPRSLWALLPSGGYPYYVGRLHVASQAAGRLVGPAAGYVLLWVPAGLTCILLVVSVVARVRRNQAGAAVVDGSGTCRGQDAGVRQLGTAMSLFCITLIFLLAAWLHSWLSAPAYVVGRYDLVAWPSLMIGIALLIELVTARYHSGRWRQTATAAGVTLVLSGCGLATILAARSVPLTHDQPRRAEQIASIVHREDLLVSLGLYRWFMAYEWHRVGFSPRVISFPPAHDRQMCWDNADAELANPARIETDVTEVTAAIEEALAGGTRVWLLAHGEPTGARWEVDRHFYARLRELGIQVRLEDEWLGLAELARGP